MLLKVSLPTEASNKAFREGNALKTINNFVEHNKPEAMYFTTENGLRTMLLVFDLKDPSMMPSAAEPFFSTFNANVTWTPLMNLDELRAGLDKALKRT
jgi:hypothetical protein